MIEEMINLELTGTWESIKLPVGKSPIGNTWVFSMKVNLNGSIAWLKAQLDAKGYA